MSNRKKDGKTTNEPSPVCVWVYWSERKKSAIRHRKISLIWSFGTICGLSRWSLLCDFSQAEKFILDRINVCIQIKRSIIRLSSHWNKNKRSPKVRGERERKKPTREHFASLLSGKNVSVGKRQREKQSENAREREREIIKEIGFLSFSSVSIFIVEWISAVTLPPMCCPR